jgi:hypothetical protein
MHRLLGTCSAPAAGTPRLPGAAVDARGPQHDRVDAEECDYEGPGAAASAAVTAPMMLGWQCGALSALVRHWSC